MQVKNLRETSRSFDVTVEHKGKEQVVHIVRKAQKSGHFVWQMSSDGSAVRQETKDFLVDVVNTYIETGKILEGHKEATYTQNEFRQWFCPHCAKPNTTEKVEQGYPLPQCEHCGEQSDWGKEGE